MYKVKEFYSSCKEMLQMDVQSDEEMLDRAIKKAEVHRPGLDLVYLKNIATHHILVFGKSEIKYLLDLTEAVRERRINSILTQTTPAVIVSRNLRPPKELILACKKQKIPLIRSSITTMKLISKIIVHLSEALSPIVTMHGTLVEVFGVGVLIQGESSVGKSEAALGLLERGHRLISDDVVKIKKKESNFLIGSGPELTRHLMEIRGIGIINVAHLYGAVCVRPDKRVDLVIKLEQWDDSHFYDRVGLEEKFCDILGVSVSFHLLPIKPGRDVILLIETISLNHRLREMGYNSAKEFNKKLLETIGKRQRKIKEVHENSKKN
jgi:HPr kinase/phosphorylase